MLIKFLSLVLCIFCLAHLNSQKPTLSRLSLIFFLRDMNALDYLLALLYPILILFSNLLVMTFHLMLMTLLFQCFLQDLIFQEQVEGALFSQFNATQVSQF